MFSSVVFILIKYTINFFYFSFNPIAKSFLTQALNRVISIESLKGCEMPSKEVISVLAETSNGDVRSSVNALQFSCRKGNFHIIELWSMC